MTPDSTPRTEQPPNHRVASTVSLPQVSPWLFRQFAGYTEWYLRRHFRQVLIHRAERGPIRDDQPLICLLNHPCWWDPLIGILLATRCFTNRTHYGAMDAKALESYGIFKRLGFFGVERGTAKGAVQFLRHVEAIAHTPATALWITPQGRYVDVRERPVTFLPGLGHAVSRLDRGLVVPIALEYFFGDERLPFAAVEFGQPIDIATVTDRAPSAWDELMTTSLTAAQDRLAARVMNREHRDLEVLVEGTAGMGNWYGWWRSWRQRRTQP